MCSHARAYDAQRVESVNVRLVGVCTHVQARPASAGRASAASTPKAADPDRTDSSSWFSPLATLRSSVSSVSSAALAVSPRLWGTCGIGVQLRKSGDAVAIKGLAPGGPAATGGVQVDDLIEAVDGEPAGKTVEEVEAALKGWEGTAVKLRLTRGGLLFPKKTVTVELKRADLKSKTDTPKKTGESRKEATAPRDSRDSSGSSSEVPLFEGFQTLMGGKPDAEQKTSASNASSGLGGVDLATLNPFVGSKPQVPSSPESHAVGAGGAAGAAAPTTPAGAPGLLADMMASASAAASSAGSAVSQAASSAQHAVGTLAGAGEDSGAGIGVVLKQNALRDGVVVDGLAPHGPAKGRLMKGDVIKKIDGKDAGKDEAGVKGQLAGSEGSKCVLVVARRGKDLTVTIERKNLNAKKEDAGKREDSAAPSQAATAKDKKEAKDVAAGKGATKAEGSEAPRPVSMPSISFNFSQLKEDLAGVPAIFTASPPSSTAATAGPDKAEVPVKKKGERNGPTQKTEAKQMGHEAKADLPSRPISVPNFNEMLFGVQGMFSPKSPRTQL